MDEYNQYFGVNYNLKEINNLFYLEAQYLISQVGLNLKNTDSELFEKYSESIKIQNRIFTAKHNLFKRNYKTKLKEFQKKEKQTNSDSFENSLAILNENGYKIDRFKTPVSEYVACIKRLEKRAKQNSRSTSNRHS